MVQAQIYHAQQQAAAHQATEAQRGQGLGGLVPPPHTQPLSQPQLGVSHGMLPTQVCVTLHIHSLTHLPTDPPILTTATTTAPPCIGGHQIIRPTIDIGDRHALNAFLCRQGMSGPVGMGVPQSSMGPSPLNPAYPNIQQLPMPGLAPGRQQGPISGLQVGAQAAADTAMINI